MIGWIIAAIVGFLALKKAQAGSASTSGTQQPSNLNLPVESPVNANLGSVPGAGWAPWANRNDVLRAFNPFGVLPSPSGPTIIVRRPEQTGAAPPSESSAPGGGGYAGGGGGAGFGGGDTGGTSGGKGRIALSP